MVGEHLHSQRRARRRPLVITPRAVPGAHGLHGALARLQVRSRLEEPPAVLGRVSLTLARSP